MDQGAKSYWTEFLGTFALCFIGQGAVCAQQAAGMPAGSLLAIAVAHGLALGVMISALGAASGGHFNPAVTLGFLVTGRQTPTSAVAYWISQLIGAMVASFLLSLIIPRRIWEPVHLGAAGLSSDMTAAGGVVVEFVLTFFLVTAVWGTAVHERAPRIGGFGIGLAVLMGILMGGPLTGAAMNPARAFGAALTSGYWAGHWVFWAAPLADGTPAALVYANLVLKRDWGFASPP